MKEMFNNIVNLLCLLGVFCLFGLFLGTLGLYQELEHPIRTLALAAIGFLYGAYIFGNDVTDMTEKPD